VLPVRGGTNVPIRCFANPNAHHCPEASGSAGSGELEAEGSGGTAKGITEGELKTLGYNEQELLQVK
jgi:hypothetical protein